MSRIGPCGHNLLQLRHERKERSCQWARQSSNSWFIPVHPLYRPSHSPNLAHLKTCQPYAGACPSGPRQHSAIQYHYSLTSTVCSLSHHLYTCVPVSINSLCPHYPSIHQYHGLPLTLHSPLDSIGIHCLSATPTWNLNEMKHQRDPFYQIYQ